MFIDLAKSDIQSRNPAEVAISPDWTICLSIDCSEDQSSGESGILIIEKFTLYIKNFSCKNVRYVHNYTDAYLTNMHA